MCHLPNPGVGNSGAAVWLSNSFGVRDVIGKLRGVSSTGLAHTGNEQHGHDSTDYPFAAYATTLYSQPGLCERREGPSQAAGPMECQAPVGRGWGRCVG